MSVKTPVKHLITQPAILYSLFSKIFTPELTEDLYKQKRHHEIGSVLADFSI